MKKWRGLFFAGMVLFAVLILAGCGSRKIDLNKYVTITASGYNSMGTASCQFNKEAFMNDYAGKIKINPDYENEIKYWWGYDSEKPEEILLDLCVNMYLEKASGLSNGDTVTLKWRCEEEINAQEYFNVELVYSDITCTVKGLEEIDTFDPFEDVDVSFEGISPEGTVTITPKYDKQEMQYINFAADRTSHLAAGDTITVTATVSDSVDSFVEKYGKIPKPTEKTYTVEGLSRYITSLDEIPEDVYSSMDHQLQNKFNEGVQSTWEETEIVDDFSLVGNYLLTRKNTVTGGANNILYYVYKVVISNEGAKNFTYYWYGYYENVAVNEDGSSDVDLNECTVSEASDGWFGSKNGDYLDVPDGKHYVAGFADIDAFFDAKIRPCIELYEFEETIQD